MVATLKKPKKKKPLPDLSKPQSIMQSGENHPSNDIILVFAGQMIEQKAIMKAEASTYKKIRQQATNAGVKVEELDEAIALGEQGIDTVVSKFQRLIHYAKALGTPIGQQLTLFAVDAQAISQETLLKEAFAQGRILALLGKDPDYEKYNKESDLGQEHTKGWYEGQQVRLEQFQRNAEATNAAAEKVRTDAAAKLAKKAGSGKGKAEAVAREAMEKLNEDPPADADIDGEEADNSAAETEDDSGTTTTH